MRSVENVEGLVVRNLCLRTKPAKPAKAQPHAAEPTDHTVEGTTPINARAHTHLS